MRPSLLDTLQNKGLAILQQTEELAKRAGMSVGHIYHYFANKEAIIEAIVERLDLRSVRLHDVNGMAAGASFS